MHKIAFRSGHLAIILLSILAFTACNNRSSKARVLVFSRTMGYHHESIADGNVAIAKLGLSNNFEVDTTTNPAYFTDDSLKNYAAVVFLSTTGDVLDYRQEAAFERFIQAGGGFVGIHAATDTEYDWMWYDKLVGAHFFDHPGIHDSFPNIQEGVINVVDKDNAATKFLPNPWKRTDEYYSFKKAPSSNDVHILLSIDESSYKGGKKMGDHPMAWYHDYDGGRAFYTELGHTKESYVEENYLKHLLAGIQYAIGDNKELNYGKATTQIPPDEDRFVKRQLAQGDFYEPTEMTILPNLDILVVQRRGEIMLYKHDTKKVKQVGFLDVYYKTLHTPGVNAEEGVLGLAKDPDFAKNNYVYIYYSPSDTSVNRLSRFKFVNDTLDKSTEKVILDVWSQREICCHTGGSIAFGPDKLLYFSAGDNSTPFDEKGAPYVNNGFAPLNDIPGHQQFDSRRSAGNSNDLRGKINRIRLHDDGTYEIPDGNLFPKGTDKTRPEIYVMGDRNPYRISIDQKTGFLYWGEVGPDANNDSMATRGPRGYDEVNQARKAGFFGWPLFVGNNYPYRAYDYSTGKPGELFDPAKPINNSRNNTGLTQLPPAQPAFIWYPYAASPDFPQVGTGGRNAMAGPVYYTDLFPKESRYPDYYNGKLIIYDWIRGWMKAVTMNKDGDFLKMEPFAPGVKLNSMIDMEVGPDGKFYCLEYGSGWFTKNPDAGLAVIDYIEGNRPPAVSAVTVNKTSGVLPFKTTFNVEAKDPENSKLTYKWNLGNGETKETSEPKLDYTFTQPGDFKVSVDVKDDKGAVGTGEAVGIYAGNETPIVSIDINNSNKSFLMPGQPVNYAVHVKDNDTAITAANLFVSADVVQGFDRAGSRMGHQEGTAAVSGKVLTQTLDCKSCHKEADKSVGPSFLAVSQKYQKDPNAMSYLTQKIMKGGSGVWGEVAMPAHPNVPQSDLNQIVSWVMSLSSKDQSKKSLPAQGKIVAPATMKPNEVFVISASYTDNGGNNSKSLTGTNSVSLPGNTMAFTGKEEMNGFTSFRYNRQNIMVFPTGKGWFATKETDLTGVGAITLLCGWQTPPKAPGSFEIHLDGADGKLIGKGALNTAGPSPMGIPTKLTIEPVKDGAMHKLYVVFNSSDKITGGVTALIFTNK